MEVGRGKVCIGDSNNDEAAGVDGVTETSKVDCLAVGVPGRQGGSGDVAGIGELHGCWVMDFASEEEVLEVVL